jgi:hypothetical protein
MRNSISASGRRSPTSKPTTTPQNIPSTTTSSSSPSPNSPYCLFPLFTSFLPLNVFFSPFNCPWFSRFSCWGYANVAADTLVIISSSLVNKANNTIL